jgi:serine/threonine-protein kinase
VELAKDLGQVELTAGLVHLAAGEHALAIEAFQRARQSEPKNPDAIRELGNALDAAGRTAEAEATFRQAVQQTPESWSALRDLGVFYNRHGRLEEAVGTFQRVVAMTPDNYASYGSLGGVYLRLGRHQEAAAVLQKSLALRPTSKAYNNLGTSRYFEGRFLEASEAYRKATQLTPSDERVWAGLADSLRWVPGNADEVAGAYRQAIALAEQQARRNPHDAELHSRLAMYHAYAGDREAADSELQEALRLNKQDGAVLFRAVLVHEQLARRDQALRALRDALKLGYSREEIGKDPALAQLREDPRYAPIASGSTARDVVR